MTLKKCFHCGLAFVIVLSLAIGNLKADEPVKSVSESGASYGQTTEESIFVSALNEYRASRGLQTVTVSGELSSACREWSTRMRQRGQLSHDSMRGGGMEICAQITQESGMNALQAWQRSSAHNAILLSSRMDTIGIGSDGIWWTMRGRQMDAERTEYTVFRTTTNVKTEVEVKNDDMPGYRVPMSVAGTRTYSASLNRPSSASSRFRTFDR